MTYGHNVTLLPRSRHRSSNSPVFTPVENAVISAGVYISAGPEGAGNCGRDPTHPDRILATVSYRPHGAAQQRKCKCIRTCKVNCPRDGRRSCPGYRPTWPAQAAAQLNDMVAATTSFGCKPTGHLT